MADEKPDAEQPKGKGKSDEDILTLARKRFKAAEEAEGDNRTKEVDDIKFAAASPDDHFQWPEAIFTSRTDVTQEGGARPCLTINPLPTHIRQVTNEQRMNRPQIKVQPVDDKGDPEVADIYNGMMRHIQVASEADLAYDLSCDAQVTAGEGFFRVLTEYCDERSHDQDIAIAPIADRFKVYLDPIGLLQHPAGRKCQWGFIIEDLPKEEYEELYGDEHPVDWDEAGIGDQADWFPSKETVRIAEYLVIEHTPANLYLWANGSTSIEGEPLPDGVMVVEKPKRTRKTRLAKCIWRKITGQAVLSTKEMPTKYLPIIRVVGNQWIIEGKPIISGIVRNAKDAVRTYNYNASMEVEMNALAPKAPFIGYAEQFEGHEDQWRKANQVNYPFLKANMIYDEATGAPIPMPLPQRAQPAMPQAAIISAKLAAADDIKKTTGQFDPSLGNNAQARSGVALQREQVKSDVGTFHYVDNLARALRYAGLIIVDMIPKVYSGKRIARILGEDGEPDHVMLDDSIQGATQDVYNEGEAAPSKAIGKIYNLGVGKYDVVVNTGPSFTTKRQEASEFLTNAIQAAKDPVMAQVLTYLALKSNDWAGAEEATEMVKKLLPKGLVPPEDGEQPQIPPEIQQAMDQAKQAVGHLSGQLDAAKQALQERDQTLKELQGQLKGKNTDAYVKMYEADKKALSEIEKVRGDVLIAKVDAVKAVAAQPDNPDARGMVAALDQMLAQMDQKIQALAKSTQAIAEHLQTFEIALAQPQAA